jgi:citrate synthase/citryl-CoA lyase
MPAVLSRIVAKSKTYLTQGCGASILAFGHAYGAYSAFGNMLDKYLARAEKEGKTTEEIAEILVKENLNSEALGVSNLMLKDPAAKRVFARAEKLGVAGKYIAFMKEIVKAAQRISKEPVDLDMLGATGAAMMDLGFSPEATWAIMAVTRAFAAGAHFCEELEREEYMRLGQTLTPKEDYDGPPDRPVPPLSERAKIAKPAQAHTPEEWKKAFIERQKLPGSGWAIVEEIKLPPRKK